jgi:acyl-coenzyme A synthetase/AMP-(fatty) acid ligase
VAAIVASDALEAEELMAWVAARVAPYKRIRAVRFVDAIPRTPAGKILRRVLIAQERQAV